MTGNNKDIIRRGIRLATAEFKLKEVAQAIGCSPQHLSTFLSGGAFGEEFTQAAERWLKQAGFWELPIPATASPASIIAAKLRGLADLLESPHFPMKAKISDFSCSIKSIYDSLDSIIAAMHEGTND